jgi:competence protein ComEA
VEQFLVAHRRALAAAVLGCVALVVLARFFVGTGTSPPARLAVPLVTAPKHVAATRVVVDVVGAVRRAGVYRLPEGKRVADAIARAGGPTRKADLALVNLAAPLGDGQQVVVPAEAAGSSSAAPSSVAPSGGAVAAGPVHLNSATVEQLDALPGVGPVTAQKIVDYRTKNGPFDSVDALDAVPGIGPARMEQLRDLVAP